MAPPRKRVSHSGRDLKRHGETNAIDERKKRLIIRALKTRENDDDDDDETRTRRLIDALVEMRANAREALWASVDCIVLSRGALCVSFCAVECASSIF